MTAKYISLCLTRVIHQWRHFHGARLGHEGEIFTEKNIASGKGTRQGAYCSQLNISIPGDTAKLRRLASSQELLCDIFKRITILKKQLGVLVAVHSVKVFPIKLLQWLSLQLHCSRGETRVLKKANFKKFVKTWIIRTSH